MNAYIKSPMNYIGGKYKILKDIIPLFPKDIHCFADLFAGGMNVSINTDAETIYVNDQIDPIIDLYRYLREKDINYILSQIDKIIREYELSKTNVDGYNKLRKDYNTTHSELMLFILTCYSFNHQIRFNNSGEFNTPLGKNRSSYNKTIKGNLVRFCERLKEQNIIFSSIDFRSFDFKNMGDGDFVYCDPPYLLTNGSYNDGNRGFKDWTVKEEKDLLHLLDQLNDKGVSFALSNVLRHKGNENHLLIDWVKNYNIHHIDKDYKNCNYHLKNKDTPTEEVLITNY